MLRSKIQPMQRAAPLVQLPALLAELGVEVDAVLNGTGVALSDLRPGVFIPFSSAPADISTAPRR